MKMRKPEIQEENPEELTEFLEDRRERRKEQGIRIKLVVFCCVLCMAIALVLKLRGSKALQKLKDMITVETAETVNATEKSQSILDMLEAAEQENTVAATAVAKNDIEAENTADTDMEEKIADIEPEQPLSAEPVKISDIYAETGTEVRFECYYPEAVSYNWETYNIHKKNWEAIESAIYTDELYRQVSAVIIAAQKDTEDIMLRCAAHMADGTEQTEVASLYVIPEIKQIAADSSYTANAGGYLCAKSVPVDVTYQDGTTDNLTGVYGLVFVEQVEDREFSTNESGNKVETITIINTEHDYSYIGTEDKELVLRYHSGDRVCDTSLSVSGKDMEAPSITGVEISGFTVSNIDEPVKTTISIHAEDNETPYPYLEYAFLPLGSEPQEQDWGRKMSFEQEITQNGTWIAYCRDQSCNIAKYEKEVIAVDQKAPEVTVRLQNTDWCQSNKIVVEAEDELSVLYLFECPETGEDSGWIERNEYEVSRNGTWKIQVKDAAGNIASKEITVSNIDSQMPVIKEIREEPYHAEEPEDQEETYKEGAYQNEENN